MNTLSLTELAGSMGLAPSSVLGARLDMGSAGLARTVESVAPAFARADTHNPKSARHDARQIKDAASAFVTSKLSVTLDPVMRVENENFLFVPSGQTGGEGSEQLLPVQQRVPLGMTTMEWETVGLTGEARDVGYGGLDSLTYVGSSDDQSSRQVGMYGVCLKWDEMQLWGAQHLGRDVPGERREAAMMAMAFKMEMEGGFGNVGKKRQGFFNNGSALVNHLAKSFGDPTLTFQEMFAQLSVIEIMWKRANGRRAISGICMPASHRLNLLAKFKDNNGSDTNAWLFALESFKWLSNITEDDRLLNASPAGGSIWQLWSSDPQRLYYESSPTPMMFGPFLDGLSTKFIALVQTAAVICKQPELIHRHVMPPLA